jgi:dienelactone hydrolase
VTIVLTGCATRRIEVPYTPASLPPAPALATLTDPFAYECAPALVTNHAEGTVDGYVVRLLRFPSAGENGQADNMVTVRYYEDPTSGPKPLVVILPIWGSHTYPSTIVTRDLLDQGRVNVMRVLGANVVIDWDALARAPDPTAFRVELKRMVERVRTSVIDLRRLLDWAETSPFVDMSRIAMVGFSESTLQVAAVMASDMRLASAVLVMGGAHPHQIFATCYGPPEVVRDAVLPRFGWTSEEFADNLAPLVRSIDPAHLGSRLNPERLLIFDAEYDDCVPPAARDALWDATGRPARVRVLSTHAGSFLAMTFLGGNHIRHRILDFFGRTLQ